MRPDEYILQCWRSRLYAANSTYITRRVQESTEPMAFDVYYDLHLDGDRFWLPMSEFMPPAWLTTRNGPLRDTPQAWSWLHAEAGQFAAARVTMGTWKEPPPSWLTLTQYETSTGKPWTHISNFTRCAAMLEAHPDDHQVMGTHNTS